MNKILFIVESPGKIKKISSILGNDYIVKASIGHIRNLDRKNLGFDVNNNFKPEYKICSDKRKVVSELKKLCKSCKEVILAADEDREGEAIAASLAEELKIKNPIRIVFNEITKTGILNALKNPRKIDKNMVDAQKARMILDKLVGYKLSPLLWGNILHGLSAGRVQSVVLRIVIDREKKIEDFSSNNTFKTVGYFNDKKKNEYKSILHEINKKKSTKDILKGEVFKLKEEKDVEKLLNIFKKSKFIVHNIHSKESLRNPSKPFITSSLQQEASIKYGFTTKRTMLIAQKLYEAGYITYMRTDSCNLSKEALQNCKSFIIEEYGKKYYKERQFKSKSKNAQEAHEAIRPTKFSRRIISGDNDRIRLYNLIWKRTVASQMSPAKINNTYIQIEITHKKKLPYYFETNIEKIVFEGYLKVYNIKNEEEDENEDDDNEENNIKSIPKKGEVMDMKNIISTEEYSKSIGRYNEASLVKKLEQYGIGRPSTFANIISKIQEKEYVIKKNINGEKKEIKILELKSNKISKKNKEILLGKEKNKLVPTDMGKRVTEYLINNFKDVMDYKFTAYMENDLDNIAKGEKIWYKVLKDFYNPFNDKYLKLKNNSVTKEKSNGRYLGEHPENKWKIYATTAKYGPVIKMFRQTAGGKVSKDIKYVSIEKPYKVDSITLKDALKLLKYPYSLGKYKEKDVMINKGPYGIYIKYNNKNFPIDQKKDLNLENIISVIKEKTKNDISSIKGEDGKNYDIKNGPYGYYISYNKTKKKKEFVSIPKSYNIKKLTEEDIENIIKENTKKKKNFKKESKIRKPKKTKNNNKKINVI
jgi:DNA topoisomerase I